ncbi:hypothetical protein KBC59_04000 [Patescibacteria group bacterium]|jgi:lysylphosphatidylglycerol synthetase-like protein (DUF2156 family)|nr:hypothetical protein [Patescibacteria group bacterium]
MKLLRTASIAFLAAATVLFSSMPAFAAGVTSQIKGGLDKAAGPSFAGTTTDLPTIIGAVVNILLTLVGVLLLAYLLYGGFMWMTAAGDEGKVKKARSLISNAIIGLVIIVSSFAIASFVLDRLSQISTGVSTEGSSGVEGEEGG